MSEWKQKEPTVNIFTCPIVVFVHRGIFLSVSLVSSQKDVVGVSLRVFNQHTMLSPTSPGPRICFLRLASRLNRWLLNGTISGMKAPRCRCRKRRKKKKERKERKTPAEETRQTKKGEWNGRRQKRRRESERESVVQDLKRRHQYVWAVLNNLLLPDQTLLN